MNEIRQTVVKSGDGYIDTKFVLDLLLHKIWPTVKSIRNIFKLHNRNGDTETLKDVFTLCCSQIKKCIINLFDIFKVEHLHQVILQETKECYMERLSWCITRLNSVYSSLCQSNTFVEAEDSIIVNPMYFVNWIDNAFDVLSKLSNMVYRTDYKDSEKLYDIWIKELMECVTELHGCLDELLLSAMTLCKYCLPSDQHIVKARCQVVLRETKALISELITGDTDKVFKVTHDSLKLPIKPSNVNVLIDVLKDVLYVLETNTNTALLALLVHCFSSFQSPVDVLKQHFISDEKQRCICNDKDDVQDCDYIKDFDLYNERVMQISSFAVSCSSDKNRILTLRSCLASLEAVDPHLVPAMMISPDSWHAQHMIKSWKEEIEDIKNSVFLIVDPVAFCEKCKQMIHLKLLDLTKENGYKNKQICDIINTACVLENFFDAYYKHEPDALMHTDRLKPLLADLNKVQLECKMVSNLLASTEDYMYPIQSLKKKLEVTYDKLLKRLKLLYSVICKINSLYHPKENEEQLFEICEEKNVTKNLSRTVNVKTCDTYNVNSQKNKENFSRSMFARSYIKHTSNNLLLSKLCKNFKPNKENLSFSVKLDELFNDSYEMKEITKQSETDIKEATEKVKHKSILYNFSPMNNRNSLRKAVLNRNIELTKYVQKPIEFNEVSTVSNRTIMDENTSLHITAILEQMTNISNFCEDQATNAVTVSTQNSNKTFKEDTKSNVLSININNRHTNTFRNVWNIPINTSTVELPLEGSNVSNTSSNVTTLERLNDLDLVEERLNNLKYLHQETTL